MSTCMHLASPASSATTCVGSESFYSCAVVSTCMHLLLLHLAQRLFGKVMLGNLGHVPDEGGTQAAISMHIHRASATYLMREAIRGH